MAADNLVSFFFFVSSCGDDTIIQNISLTMYVPQFMSIRASHDYYRNLDAPVPSEGGWHQLIPHLPYEAAMHGVATPFVRWGVVVM